MLRANPSNYAPINDNPHPRDGWGNSGDLTKCCVENPTHGALPNVNIPIDPNLTLGDLTLDVTILYLYFSQD